MEKINLSEEKLNKLESLLIKEITNKDAADFMINYPRKNMQNWDPNIRPIVYIGKAMLKDLKFKYLHAELEEIYK